MSRNPSATTKYVPKRVGVRPHTQKPQRITRDEALNAARNRGIYENAKAIVEAARAKGLGIWYAKAKGQR